MSETPFERSSDALPPQGGMAAWWRQGFRTAMFRRPDWSGLTATPAKVALLLVVPFALGVWIERLYIVGDARFYWPAFQMGWLTTLLTAWICWASVKVSDDTAASTSRAPSSMALFSMLLAQGMTLEIVLALVFVPLVRSGALVVEDLSAVARWALVIAPLGWVMAAECRLIWLCGTISARGKAIVMSLLCVSAVFSQTMRPLAFWYPQQAQEAAVSPERPPLTPENLETQAGLLSEQLRALEPRHAGQVNVYVITFAPYGEEDVFRRESSVVARVMAERFGASGHVIELVNNPATLTDLPWATPSNLRRAIDKIATLMDRDKDILLLHLTSHGGQDGVLSASLMPLSIEPLTPGALKDWLDTAGVRYRVVSVSACYSGSWIEPLAGDGTLVMTAADAEHTSFGCGSRSELTYFGRAMFDEQLRHTWSFEEAHAAARKVIDEREQAAGKRDGFSNPQIRVGAGVRERLGQLAQERASSTAN